MASSLRTSHFRVIDVETTGVDRHRDAVVELAWAVVREDGTLVAAGESFVIPERPVPAEATRVHSMEAEAPRDDLHLVAREPDGEHRRRERAAKLWRAQPSWSGCPGP